MKKSKEIVGLPVISISEGLQIGDVKGLFINPKEKNVEFLLLDEKGFSSELKGIPFLSAEAIGDFAVIVDSKCGIIDIMKVGLLRDTINLDVDIIGIKVITTKGKYLGDVTEYSVDAGEGEIKSFYFQSKTDNTEYIIPAANVITIGKEALIIEDKDKKHEAEKTEEKVVAKAEDVKKNESVKVASPQEPKAEFPVERVENKTHTPAEGPKQPEPVKEPESEKKAPEAVEMTTEPAAVKAPTPRINDVIGQYQKQSQLKDEVVPAPSPLEEKKEPEAVVAPVAPKAPPEPAKEVPIPAPVPAEQPKAAKESGGEEKGTVNKLVEQQKQYVLGKTLIRDIKDDKGEVIAKENEIVTEDIFMNLYKSGPNKIVEAMTYVKD